VVAWFDAVDGDELLLSVLTIGELRAGVERLRRRDPAQAEAIAAWMATLVQTYADFLVPIDAEIARRWGELSAARPLPVVDGLLAASADVRGAVLVTRNTKDFVGLAVTLLNPFDDGR
jgi:hypothetical protein